MCLASPRCCFAEKILIDYGVVTLLILPGDVCNRKPYWVLMILAEWGEKVSTFDVDLIGPLNTCSTLPILDNSFDSI